jgi:hypothetical protein
MSLRLTIVGCGWHAHVVAELAELTDKYNQIQLLDRDWPAKTVWGDWPVVGGFDVLKQDLSGVNDDYFVALGDNNTRLALCRQIVENGGTLATLIHPKAFVSPRALATWDNDMCRSNCPDVRLHRHGLYCKHSSNG